MHAHHVGRAIVDGRAVLCRQTDDMEAQVIDGLISIGDVAESVIIPRRLSDVSVSHYWKLSYEGIPYTLVLAVWISYPRSTDGVSSSLELGVVLNGEAKAVPTSRARMEEEPASMIGML